MILPELALSVRQPWAWAIVYARKNCENRSQHAIRLGNMRSVIGQRIAIHAAKGMTRDEYEEAAAFIRGLAGDCPEPHELERGGIIGSAHVASIVSATEFKPSPWYFGPAALMLADAEPAPFVGATGQLGIFRWQPNGQGPEPAAKWMRPRPLEVADCDLKTQPRLL